MTPSYYPVKNQIEGGQGKPNLLPRRLLRADPTTNPVELSLTQRACLILLIQASLDQGTQLNRGVEVATGGDLT